MTYLSPHEALLLTRIKATPPDDSAIVELINLHTGIYHTIAARYAKAYPDVIKLDDLKDERMTHIYEWVIGYDEERGMKLSSYVGDMTDYLCKGILRKARHDPLSTMVEGGGWRDGGDGVTSTVMAPIQPDHNTASGEDSTHATSSGKTVHVVDETEASKPAEVASDTVALDDILRAVEDPELALDPRFRRILKWRHFTEPPLTWRAIRDQLNGEVTHEGARKIYNRGIALLKGRVGSKWSAFLALYGKQG